MRTHGRSGRATRGKIRWIPAPGQRHPGLWAAVLLAAGICLGNALVIPWYIWGVALSALVMVLLLSSRWRATGSIVVVGLVWFALGAFRYTTESQLLPADDISRRQQMPQNAEFFGRITDLPDRRTTSTHLLVELQSMSDKEFQREVSGRVLVRVYRPERTFSYGDYIRFTGRLRRPPSARNSGTFDYREYLATRGIRLMVDVSARDHISVYPNPSPSVFINGIVVPIREYILTQFRQNLPPVSASLLAGYLIGETRDMPPQVYEAYRRAGTLHLLAVSGSNVWLVLGFFWIMLRVIRVPRGVQVTLLLSVLLTFCFVTRNDPSVVRAGVMAALVLIGWLLYRRPPMLNIIGISAIIILLVSPFHLFRAGFQLSYAAILGIILTMGAVELPKGRRLSRRVLKYIVALVASSIAATVATAPILALHFGVIPSVAIVANMVMVPLAMIVTYAGVGLILVGNFWPPLSTVIAGLAQQGATWSLYAAEQFSHMPLGEITWTNPRPLELVSYAVTCSALLSLRLWFRWIKPAIAFLLAMMMMVAVAWALDSPRKAGVIIFADTGWEPLTVIALPDDSIRLVGSESSFVPSRFRWIIDPLLRHHGWSRRGRVLDTLIRPRLAGDVRAVAGHVSDPASPDKPVYTMTNFRTAGSLVAQVISLNDAQVMILYYPDLLQIQDLKQHLVGDSLAVIALPGYRPTGALIESLQELHPSEIVLFGQSTAYPGDDWHALWERHFPESQVYSNTRHGGVIVRLTTPPRIIPTIPDLPPNGL